MNYKTLSVRLEEQLFDAIEKRAEAEGKTKTDLIKELIQIAMAPQEPAELNAVLHRINIMEESLKDLITKGAVCSAANRFYGKQITTFMVDLGTHLQGKTPVTKEEKATKVEERDRKAMQYAEQFLRSDYKPESR
ncbi:MAG: ribbon-helix-helix protein, CopG family [Cyanobacteriota/Melainabacteria group bacterium]